MQRPNTLPRIVAMLSLAAVSACGGDDNGTGPSGLEPTDYLDVAGTAISGITTAVLENEAKATLDALGSYISAVAAQPAPAQASAVAARIPADAIGGTFIYNFDIYGYVLDETRTGAPADGVRFILYEIASNQYEPANPLVETGYFDIRDLTVGENLDVRHEAVIGGETQLAFDVTGTVTESTADLTTTGTLSSGTTDLDFTFDFQGDLVSGADFTISGTAGPYTLFVDYQRDGQYGTGPGSDLIRLEDSQSNAKIEIIVNWDAQYLVTSGSVVEFNDVVVADITGSGGFPEVTPRDGSGLDVNDGYLIVDGYFAAFLIEGQLLGFTQMGVTNSGRYFPYF